MPPPLVERVALEFLLFLPLFLLFVIGRAVFEHALVLVAPPIKLPFDGPHVDRAQRHEHIHKLGLIHLARGMWRYRARRIRRRWAFGDLSPAC